MPELLRRSTSQPKAEAGTPQDREAKRVDAPNRSLRGFFRGAHTPATPREPASVFCVGPPHSAASISLVSKHAPRERRTDMVATLARKLFGGSRRSASSRSRAVARRCTRGTPPTLCRQRRSGRGSHHRLCRTAGTGRPTRSLWVEDSTRLSNPRDLAGTFPAWPSHSGPVALIKTAVGPRRQPSLDISDAPADSPFAQLYRPWESVRRVSVEQLVNPAFGKPRNFANLRHSHNLRIHQCCPSDLRGPPKRNAGYIYI